MWLLCMHAQHHVWDLCDVFHACALRAVFTHSCQHCCYEVNGSVKRPQVSGSLTAGYYLGSGLGRARARSGSFSVREQLTVVYCIDLTRRARER